MYNRIHNDIDSNVVRVELNSSYRPRHSITNHHRNEPTSKITSSNLNRNDTFTKRNDRPTTGIIRSETFIVKHHNNNNNNGNYYDSHESLKFDQENGGGDTCKKKQSHPDRGDKVNYYDTYTRRKSSNRSEIRDITPDNDNSHNFDTNTYRKYDKHRASLLSQESENLNADTFTKSTKPKRVESFIKKIEKNLWRRKETKKEPSPAPSSQGSDQSTIKRSKNLFNLISSSVGGRKSTREVEIQCKIDEDKEYYKGIAVKKSSKDVEKKVMRPARASQQRIYENGSDQRITSIMKSSQQQRQPDRHLREYESNRKSSTPAPIRIEIDLRNTNKRPIGVASPLPQKMKSTLKNGNYDGKQSSHAPSSLRLHINGNNNNDNGNNLRRDGNERVSFREYREQLRAKGGEYRQKVTDTSDDDLRKSYQQSFFIPM